MPQKEAGEIRTRKRVTNACQRCRKHKIKCSGSEPCTLCQRRGQLCEFGPEDKKVVVSESILHDLKSRLNQLEQQQHQSQLQGNVLGDFPTEPAYEPMQGTVSLGQQHVAVIDDPAREPENLWQSSHDASAVDVTAQHAEEIIQASSPEETIDSDQNAGVSNPLVPEQPAFIADVRGRLRYLGHSSTWSFSRQVLQMAHHSPHSNSSTTGSIHVEGEAYSIETEKPVPAAADIAGLPSMDLSTYYLQTVKFRMHPLLHLFDEIDFSAQLHQFYESPPTYAQAHRTWFVHYLIIMAFGKAFVAQAQSINGPRGSELFKRALKLLPDIHHLCLEPVSATEILCCIALYLISIDHRAASHIYIGQAIRMAQNHGLHTDLQPDAVGEALVIRGRRIWWTVYTLDRKISCNLGVANSLHDEDITAVLPNQINSDGNATAQSLHVQICRLMGNVMNTVYSRQGELNKTYVTTAQKVLRGIAHLTNDLKTFSEGCFGEVSRVAAQLNLAYHQCILLVSRPILFHLLRVRLETGRDLRVSASAKGLIQVCIDSAVQIVTILSDLRQHELLDTFLPFDLECAFSAAFILVMASTVLPKLNLQNNWLNTVMDVFDHVIMKGNVLSELRKSEVEELQQTLFRLGRKHQNNASDSGTPLAAEALQTNQTPLPDYASLPSLGEPFFDEWLVDDGLTGAQILNLADALQPGGFGNYLLQSPLDPAIQF